MKVLLLSIILGVAALPTSTRVEAKANLISQHAKLTGCKEIAHGDLERGEDWVYFRCEGLGSMRAWYICRDSARCSYGFGLKPNISGPFGLGRVRLVEWRGLQRNGHFEPVAVIVRLPSADREATARTSLMVYRLRADGTSCIVGATSSNVDARKVADGSTSHFQCVEEPSIP